MKLTAPDSPIILPAGDGMIFNFPQRPSAVWEARQWAKNNRAALDAAWDALPDVPRTIEQHIKGTAA